VRRREHLRRADRGAAVHPTVRLPPDQSELHAVMTGGFATIAAGVMAVYIDFGVPAVHLIAASVMAAPAGLAVSKLLFPEEGEPETRGHAKTAIERPWSTRWTPRHPAPPMASSSPSTSGDADRVPRAARTVQRSARLDRWAGGRADTLARVALCPPPGSGGMARGVPWEECGRVGVLFGKKTILNEFIAYLDLKVFLDNAKALAAGSAAVGSLPVLSERAVVLSTYALCGFANIGSIAIQIGGYRRHRAKPSS